MRRSTTFTRGSGCYNCQSCGRVTRDDGNGDSVGLRLCTQCYDLGGLFNAYQDGDTITENEKKNIKATIDFLKTKGGKIDSDWWLMLVDRPTKAQLATLPFLQSGAQSFLNVEGEGSGLTEDQQASKIWDFAFTTIRSEEEEEHDVEAMEHLFNIVEELWIQMGKPKSLPQFVVDFRY